MSQGPFGRREAPVSERESPARKDPGWRRRTHQPTPPQRSPATWIAGALATVLLIYITINTLTTKGPGSRGVPAGESLPVFAAPLATSTLDGYANLNPKRACLLGGPRVVNLCDIEARGPLALVFLTIRSHECEEQVDNLIAARRRHPNVQVVAVSIRDDRGDLRNAIRRRGWRIPVAHDKGGGITNAYAVAICPTVTYADRGGIARATSFGLESVAEVERRMARLR